jgi:hypothetical protein
MSTSRPTALEWALVAFCFLADFTITLPAELSWGEGRSPYSRYYGNVGINLINIGALIVDVLVVALIIGWLISPRLASHALRTVMLLAAIGAALTWAELWYGSTFYYGEVRDKQGLPLSVNNVGIVGSYVFLGYLSCRVATHAVRRPAVFAVIPVSLVASWFAHSAVLALLKESWLLLQS